jgi:hypothetical protein
VNVKEKILREVEETVDVICNRCKASCKGDIGNFNGLIDAHVFGAYDSKTLADGTHYTFSVCETCLAEWFKSFQLDPCQNPDWCDDEGGVPAL